MDFRKLKRAFRLQLPPDHPYEAGPFVGSRVFEALPRIFPVVTFSFILISAVLYYLADIQPRMGNETGITYYELDQVKFNLGFRDNLNIVLGDYWGCITSAFFHGNELHIIMNSLGLITLGSLIERGLGSIRTLILYLSIAFVSSAYQVGIDMIYHLDIPFNVVVANYSRGTLPFNSSLGLSGIIFGLVGFMWGAWKRWTGFLTVFNPKLLKYVFFWQILCFLLTFTGALGVANTAHIAGFIFGFFVGMWMCYGIKNTKLWFGLTLAMLALIAGVFAMHYFHYSEFISPIREYLEVQEFIR